MRLGFFFLLCVRIEGLVKMGPIFLDTDFSVT